MRYCYLILFSDLICMDALFARLSLNKDDLLNQTKCSLFIFFLYTPLRINARWIIVVVFLVKKIWEHFV